LNSTVTVPSGCKCKRSLAKSGHFIIAWSCGEGDDAPLLQVSQDALTGSLNNELDIGLGRVRGGLEDGRWLRGIRNPRLPRFTGLSEDKWG